MSDTPTPRTNSAINKWVRNGSIEPVKDELVKLERELAEMTKFRDLLANKEMELLKQLTAHKAALEKCEKALPEHSNSMPRFEAMDEIAKLKGPK